MIDIREHGGNFSGGKSTKSIMELKASPYYDNVFPMISGVGTSNSSAYNGYGIYDKGEGKMIHIRSYEQYAYTYDKYDKAINNFNLGGSVTDGRFFYMPSSDQYFFREKGNYRKLTRISQDWSSTVTSAFNTYEACVDIINSVIYATWSNSLSKINPTDLSVISNISFGDGANINCMQIDNNLIYLLSSVGPKIYVYDLNLNLVRTITITETCYYMAVIGGRIFVAGSAFLKEIDANTGADINRIVRPVEGTGGYQNLRFYNGGKVSPMLIIPDSYSLSVTPVTGGTSRACVRFYDLSLNQKLIIGPFETSTSCVEVADDVLAIIMSSNWGQSTGVFRPRGAFINLVYK